MLVQDLGMADVNFQEVSLPLFLYQLVDEFRWKPLHLFDRPKAMCRQLLNYHPIVEVVRFQVLQEPAGFGWVIVRDVLVVGFCVTLYSLDDFTSDTLLNHGMSGSVGSSNSPQYASSNISTLGLGAYKSAQDLIYSSSSTSRGTSEKELGRQHDASIGTSLPAFS